MRISEVEIIGFRGIEQIKVPLEDITVFHGDMGTGKTSKLQGIMFGLTGRAPSYLNLDDLININSDFMWVKITGLREEQEFTLERRKRRGRPSEVKSVLDPIPEIEDRIYIEGREISRLFLGAPTEKALRIDALLGLSHFSQIAGEISPAQLDSKINELSAFSRSLEQSVDAAERLAKVEAELSSMNEELSKIQLLLTSMQEEIRRCEEIRNRAEETRRIAAQYASKENLIQEHKRQLASIPPPSSVLEDELKELQARYEAMQRRITFLEAAMETLQLEGRRIEDLEFCPLCGSRISPVVLDKFRHYSDEYWEMMSRAGELELLLNDKKKQYEKSRSDRERALFLQNETEKLVLELAAIPKPLFQEDEIQRAFAQLKEHDDLQRRKEERTIRQEGLEGQKRAYDTIISQIKEGSIDNIQRKIERLSGLKERLMRIRTTIVEVVSEIRSKQINALRQTFKDTFRKIYPYPRFTDVDFETKVFRGKETLTVKAKTNGAWIYSNQMSTGENVALSFALLYAINDLEKSPILLFDEPEEGLDTNGIKGLVDVFRNIKKSTQIIIATRSEILAQLLDESRLEIAPKDAG